MQDKIKDWAPSADKPSASLGHVITYVIKVSQDENSNKHPGCHKLLYSRKEKRIQAHQRRWPSDETKRVASMVNTMKMK